MKLSEIIGLEPRVGELLAEARQAADNGNVKYAQYKARLTRLVGWESPVEELRDQAAYSTALRALSDALSC